MLFDLNISGGEVDMGRNYDVQNLIGVRTEVRTTKFTFFNAVWDRIRC